MFDSYRSSPVARRVSLIALVALLGAVLAWQFGRDVTANSSGLEGYVLSWGGAMFRALGGAALGYAISRFGVGLDLSRIAEERRPNAALSQSILIGSLAIAVALGV
jgi:hypothetical protein